MKIYLMILLSFLILAPHSNAQIDVSDPSPSTYRKDIDGDGKPDKFFYQIKRWQDDYEGALIITSAKGKVLWEHHWPMAKGDVGNLLATEEDITRQKVSLENWVRRFFNGNLYYGAKFQQIKLKASDLDSEQINYAAKLARVSSRKLRRDILSQRVNTVFEYRAEWREDLMSLVYVPPLKKFVCYHRGY
jgi:hypothetical protein